MKITELIADLTVKFEVHGDREVLVHCSGCCPHGHEIMRMAIGGENKQDDEREALVIEAE